MRKAVIIGAGVIGSSVAMHLAGRGKGRFEVLVLDGDLEGPFSSSELNAGGVRATWGQPLNIELSKRSIEYMADHADEVGYRACGYLWLVPPEKMEDFRAARALQHKHGWEVEEWDPTNITERVPFLDRLDGVSAGFYGVRDGLVNPNLLKRHYREEAKKAGALFQNQHWLLGSDWKKSEGCRLKFRKLERTPTMENLSGEVGAGEEIEIQADLVINCAGSWAGVASKALGYVADSFPERRQISLFECRDVDLTPYGMIVDTTGVYFHPEAMNGLAGFADPEEKKGMNYEYDGEDFFREKIWPALYERSSHFERLKHVGGWAGQYELSPDHSAIVGKVSEHLYEAHSFSGHGIMQSYAAGEELVRMILGEAPVTDISALSGSRFRKGLTLRETRVI